MNRKLSLILVISFLSCFVFSCYTMPPVKPEKAHIDSVVTVDVPYDKVFSAFIDYFNDNNYTIITSDDFTGKMVTDDIMITDTYMIDYYYAYIKENQIEPYYKKSRGQLNRMLLNGEKVRFDYCDCGNAMPLSYYKLNKDYNDWQNLFYHYEIDIKKESNDSTSFRVQTKFWTELFKVGFMSYSYEGIWDCYSTGEYEKKLIEEIKTKYLKK